MVGDFVLAFLLLGGGLWALLLKSAQKDRADAEKERAQDRREEAAAREEARKYQAGTPLVCLLCDVRFRGPLPESGCPKCHLASLVMTEAQAAQAKHRETEQN